MTIKNCGNTKRQDLGLKPESCYSFKSIQTLNKNKQEIINQ